MPALATTDRLIERSPDTASAAIRALVACQTALREDPSRATEVGRRRFPPREMGLIAAIVERDLPFYDAALPEAAIAGVTDFCRGMAVLARDVPYAEVVATQFCDLWRSAG